MAFAVLIPALNPSGRVVEVVEPLAADERVARIILVDDGSDVGSAPIFAEAKARSEGKATLLRHAVNRGKGAALQTGINHFLCESAPEDVLVTADADGQHLPRDILAVAAQGALSPGALVLGSRGFSGGVPLRSRLGNRVTRRIFRLLAGKDVPDTQTGLRAIPRALLPKLLRLRAQRYEFEMEMLLLAAREHLPMSFVPIETVYLEDNSESHFNPLIDSMRIYLVFLRFLSLSKAP